MTILRSGFLSLVLLGAACGASTPDLAVDEQPELESGKADARRKIAGRVTQTNLVSDQPGVAAVTDPQLVNAWGIAFNPNGGAWISDNHSGLTTVYDAAGALKLTVTLPGANAGAAAPTGQVANDVATDFFGDKFIFVSEDGTISGWQPAGGAKVHVDNSKLDSNYKGVAIADAGDGVQLYAAAFRTGTVDVFDSEYKPVVAPGGFVDSTLPKGYAPFNVAAIDGVLFVTYAKQDAEKGDDAHGPGRGYIDAFDTDGFLIQRVVSGGFLNSPWGLAIAPASFGKIAGHLLVGNFGDGRINSYKLPVLSYGSHKSALSYGCLGDASGAPLQIDGLWAIVFAPDTASTKSDQLYFTAGPGGEDHGLYGRITLNK